MGHVADARIIYVGLARLPQPLVGSAPGIAVELEVEPRSRQIVAASTNLQFPGLERLLGEILVGKAIDALTGCALLELEVRYSAPFATAVRAAVQAAVGRAVAGAGSRDGASPRSVNGRQSGDEVSPQPAAAPSA
ncbi:MAG: hypothetical protein A2148_12435 [Chloroflexi bacterium RBG_16_68_14]|nr:MAG: hypothetical protein A2148_12435 [Chloroflexi bacterium RBG_16_68_14]